MRHEYLVYLTGNTPRRKSIINKAIQELKHFGFTVESWCPEARCFICTHTKPYSIVAASNIQYGILPTTKVTDWLKNSS